MCVRACTHACVYVRAHAHVCVCAHIAQVVLSNIPQCCFLIFFEYHYTHKVETFLFNAEHEIRTEKCSEICTVASHFGSDICQIKMGFVQVNTKSCYYKINPFIQLVLFS